MRRISASLTPEDRKFAGPIGRIVLIAYSSSGTHANRRSDGTYCAGRIQQAAKASIEVATKPE